MSRGPNPKLELLRTLGRAVILAGGGEASPVGHSRELERICAIPRHAGYTDAQRNELRAIVTRPEGTMALWDHQADALLAALEGSPELCGLFAPLAVGKGKTLICALLPTVLQAKKPLILTTAALREQTRRLLDTYREHFHLLSEIQVEGYSVLSHKNHADLLYRIKPDVIIADEAHSLRNPTSARTKRFLRYMKKHPDTIFIPLSGTMCKRSIRDYAALLHLSLREWTPLPRDYPTLRTWSEAIDPDATRPPGALFSLDPSGETEDIREVFANRLNSTRGVVASPKDALGSTLVVRTIDVELPEDIEVAQRLLRERFERPDGEELMTAMELMDVDRQLRFGGYYGWKYPPNPEWLAARRAFRRAVRWWLGRYSKDGLDSPGLVFDALAEGTLSMPEYDAWVAIKDLHEEPPKEWRWIDSSALGWVRECKPPCVIFTNYVAVGEEVADILKAPYYGEGEKAASAILAETGDRTIVCSLRAHGQGRNLQHFNRAWVLSATPTGSVWEQLLGRLHRSGQNADEVIYFVPSFLSEELAQACQDAKFIEKTMNQPQKLNSCVLDR